LGGTTGFICSRIGVYIGNELLLEAVHKLMTEISTWKASMGSVCDELQNSDEKPASSCQHNMIAMQVRPDSMVPQPSFAVSTHISASLLFPIKLWLIIDFQFSGQKTFPTRSASQLSSSNITSKSLEANFHSVSLAPRPSSPILTT
jgi:hypothetical protein